MCVVSVKEALFSAIFISFPVLPLHTLFHNRLLARFTFCLNPFLPLSAVVFGSPAGRLSALAPFCFGAVGWFGPRSLFDNAEFIFVPFFPFLFLFFFLLFPSLPSAVFRRISLTDTLSAQAASDVDIGARRTYRP